MTISRYTVIGFLSGLGVFVAAVAFICAYISREPIVYEGTTRIAVIPSLEAAVPAGYIAARALPAFAASSAAAAGTGSSGGVRDIVLDRTCDLVRIALTGPACPARDEIARLRAVLDRGAGTITLTYRGKSERSARVVLESVLKAVAYVQASARLQIEASARRRGDSARLSLLESVALNARGLRVLEPPHARAVTAQQRAATGITLTVVLWSLSGIAAFAAVALLNPTVCRVGQLLAMTGLPVIGWIDRFPGRQQAAAVLPGIDRLTVSLRAWLKDSGCDIVVTSPDEGDGKSLLAAALALTLARRGLRVTLVDGNLQYPAACRLFSLDGLAGLSDHLMAPPKYPLEAIRHEVMENLFVVPRGLEMAYAGILAGPAFADLAAALRRASDVVIYDCQSASQSQDFLALAGSKAVLLAVVRLQHSSSKSLRLLSAMVKSHVFARAGLVVFGADARAAVKAFAGRPEAAGSDDRARPGRNHGTNGSCTGMVVPAIRS